MPPVVLLDIYKPFHNDKTVRLLIYYSFFLLFLHIWDGDGVQIRRDRGLVPSPVIIIIGVHFLILIEVLASARHLVYSGQTQQTYNFSFVRSGGLDRLGHCIRWSPCQAMIKIFLLFDVWESSEWCWLPVASLVHLDTSLSLLPPPHFIPLSRVVLYNPPDHLSWGLIFSMKRTRETEKNWMRKTRLVVTESKVIAGPQFMFGEKL